MVIPYLVKTDCISVSNAKELARYGSVGLVSKSFKTYLLHADSDYIEEIKALPFVVVIEEDSRGYM